jgi:hypothetical protein
MSAYGRVALEQAVVNHKKIVRTAIRLRHSIEADNELNDIMPVVERKLRAMQQQGLIPSMDLADVMKLLDEG